MSAQLLANKLQQEAEAAEREADPIGRALAAAEAKLQNEQAHNTILKKRLEECEEEVQRYTIHPFEYGHSSRTSAVYQTQEVGASVGALRWCCWCCSVSGRGVLGVGYSLCLSACFYFRL